jgi:glycine/D-amino acid oxidase-like deaminating enzyme
MPKSEPYWWEDAGAPAGFPPGALPEEVDVLIVGAGLTGASAARTAAKGGKSVLALDAGVPGIGASSRNGGQIGGGHRLSADELIARFGEATAIALLEEAHHGSTAFARTLMAEEGIACDYTECGRFRALWQPGEYEAAARATERLQTLFGLEAEMVPRTRQRDEVASDLYSGGVLYPRHGALNPAKWVAGLLAAAHRAGAQIQGETPVTRVTRDGPGWQVETPRGRVRAGAVLVATNGYTPAGLPQFKRRIIPVPSFIVATEELGENRMRSLFPNGRIVSESRERHCYYRISPDGKRLVFGGRAALFDAPEGLAQSQLRTLIAQVFPDLGAVGFSHSWRGRTGFTFDYLPRCGQLDGIWYAMGYSGSGNAMAPYLGHKAALQILGDPEGETAFSRTGFPARWWHRGQPWFLPFADLMFRGRDILANRRRGS